MDTKFKKSILWVSIGRYSRLVITLIVTMILSRLLSPEDFGVVAAVMIVNGFLYTLVDAGIPSAVIQKKNLTDDDKYTFATFGLISGLLIATILYFISGFIATYMSMEKLSIVLPVLSVNIIFIGILGVPQGILQRGCRFSELAKVEVISVVFSGVIAIILAIYGFSYWSLILQLITQLVVKFLMCSYYSGFVYRKFLLKKSSLIYLKRYSGFLVMFTSINYWSRNFDNLIIGKIYGEVALGMYSQAYRLMQLPSILISSVVNAVIHPIFAENYNNNVSMERNYSEIFSTSLLLASPFAAVMFFYPKEVLQLLWGEQWIYAADLLKVLSLLTLIQPALVTTGNVYKATDNNKLLFKIGMLNTCIVLIFIYGGSFYGLVGVAIGYTIGYACFVMPITIYSVYSLALKVDYRTLYTSLKTKLAYIIAIYIMVGITKMFIFELISTPIVMSIISSSLVLFIWAFKETPLIKKHILR